MTYTDGDIRTNAEGAVGMSNMAILLVTKSYLQDAIDPNSKVANELRLLKAYQTPAILIFFKGEKLDAEQLLAGLNVVERLYDAPRDDFDKWLKANLNPLMRDYRGKTYKSGRIYLRLEETNMSERNKDKNIVRTSIKQPRELWNKVRNDAINQNSTTDRILTEILKEHYGGDPK